ncbi:mitochondrial inner-membrane-bound regulator domain-containing protein [Purpureocillium lavendulum]|uniref:Mitochondrial inner-membrane-bound regulator domain-containing protein n=1 Tax=Purpureocillium lavendulum TaxID=1247861 RepID=A0AB34FYA0_9HYPO|nr:mitochondrial inner-membrane-bound regulator domain-containing protein [Purpureocillium lavendulum]
MLSRAVTLPRICLSCRLALARRNATPQLRNGVGSTHGRARQFASDSGPADKERVEALISGSLKHGSAADGSRSASGKRKSKRSKGDDEPAAWEFPPEEISDAPKVPSSQIPEIPEIIEEATVYEPDAAPKSESRPVERTTTGRSRVFRHDLLNHQHLGVDALGKPVEALILKNPNKMTRSKKSVPILEEAVAVTGTPLRWEDMLPAEQGPEYDFSDEVYGNIEEFRPTDTKVLPRRDFDKLVDALVDGFTREQLVGYFNKGNWGQEPQRQDGPSYAWAVKQAPWKAAQPNNWATLKPKQQHAVLILAAKWGLEVQEQVEGFGRSLVWLKPNVFQLISRSSSRILETLSADLLDKSSNERISTNNEDSRLGIYARKSTVPLILERIDDVVKSMSTKAVPLRSVEEENLTDPVLDELGRITSTTVQYDREKQELAVSWLSQDTPTPIGSMADSEPSTTTQTEDPADIVLRLLPRREPVGEPGQVQIITSPQPPSAQKGAFVGHHRERRTMSWRDKLRQWSRYVNPVGKELPMDRKPLDFRKEISFPESTIRTANSQAATHLTATFGHVLHTQHIAKESKMAKSRRILSPVVPHPAALTSITADTDKPISQSTAIILNFAPDLAHDQPQGDAVPHIRLTLPVNPDTDLSAFAFPPDSTLEGAMPRQVHDVLLPDESVDVRLVQQQLFPLDTQQQSLKDFLAVSEFNLLAGRLRTPSRATFSVPGQWLFQGGGDKASLEQPTDVPYLFMGLEIHQIVDLEWRGHTLRYNSIEAGQHGGQRQELSLLAGVPGLNSQTPTSTTPKQPARFLQLAEEIATGEHFSWDEGYRLMQDRSDEQFSWDMLDESFDGEALVAEQVLAEEAEEEELNDAGNPASGEKHDSDAPESPNQEPSHVDNVGGAEQGNQNQGRPQ